MSNYVKNLLVLKSTNVPAFKKRFMKKLKKSAFSFSLVRQNKYGIVLSFTTINQYPEKMINKIFEWVKTIPDSDSSELYYYAACHYNELRVRRKFTYKIDSQISDRVDTETLHELIDSLI